MQQACPLGAAVVVDVLEDVVARAEPQVHHERHRLDNDADDDGGALRGAPVAGAFEELEVGGEADADEAADPHEGPEQAVPAEDLAAVARGDDELVKSARAHDDAAGERNQADEDVRRPRRRRLAEREVRLVVHDVVDEGDEVAAHDAKDGKEVAGAVQRAARLARRQARVERVAEVRAVGPHAERQQQQERERHERRVVGELEEARAWRKRGGSVRERNVGVG